MSDDDSSSGITGKLIKWTIILILTGMTGGTFLIFYLGWKYVKLCILFYFKALYFIIRIPIWLFIQLPLHYLGVGIHKTSHSLKQAYGVIVTRKKRYGLLFGSLTLFMIYNFLPRNTDAMISFLTDATLILPLLGLIPFGITFLIAWISAHASSPDIARKDMPGGLNTGMKERTATAGAAAAAVGQAGLKGYNSVDGDNMAEKAENAREAASTAKKGVSKAKSFAESGEAETLLADDMVAVLGDMPFMSSLLGGAGEAAGMAGTAVGASGGTILVAIVLLFIGFLIINAILAALTFWIAGIVIPMIIGPIMGPILGALGLGQAYGSWIGSEVANNFLPQVNLEEETRMIQQAGAKVSCALQGPACLRQWRMNHTTRPGSEDVGEKYRLEVKQFSVGGQGGVDIAYKRPKYRIPVSFLLLNTRHGLKGIDARSVRWRVRIIDSKRTGEKSYCSTGWKSVSSQVREGGTILPGTSFSPSLTNLSELTISECEMLHPALGHDYTGELDVKYDYSSQSTLYVRAMSRRNMRDEGIVPEFKKSKTADTPVETFINVKEPITYVESSNAGSNSPARSVPFTVKVGTGTDRFDVEYRVHPNDFKVVDSSKTTSTGNCIGLNNEAIEGENTFGLSTPAQNRMESRINPQKTETWYDKAKNPSPARCTFELTSPGLISPTGETLTMRVDANYTVVIEETSEPFEVRNTLCTRVECPVLFYATGGELQTLLEGSSIPPEDKFVFENEQDNRAQLSDAYEIYQNATCKGIDAGNGCAAVESYQYRGSNIYGDSEIVAENELAVKWTQNTADTGSWGEDASISPIFSCKARTGNVEFDKQTVVGIPLDELQEVKRNPSKVFIARTGDLIVHEYKREFSTELFSRLPDWFATASYSKTKKAVGCTDDGRPKYKVQCSSFDVGGGAMYVAGGVATGGTGVLAAGAADFLTDPSSQCSQPEGSS